VKHHELVIDAAVPPVAPRVREAPVAVDEGVLRAAVATA